MVFKGSCCGRLTLVPTRYASPETGQRREYGSGIRAGLGAESYESTLTVRAEILHLFQFDEASDARHVIFGMMAASVLFGLSSIKTLSNLTVGPLSSPTPFETPSSGE